MAGRRAGCERVRACEHGDKRVYSHTPQCLLCVCWAMCPHMCVLAHLGVSFCMLGHVSTCLHMSTRLCTYIPGHG